ncbi:MAG: hypothetical protein J7L96_09695, partial [Bacteroidales bacterium]|nr:hypothetical protein [Bacteroidales bacterium]
YNKKIWELDEQVKLVDKDIEVKTKDFPFTTQVKAHYTANNLLTEKDDTYSLSLKNWFNHVIYDNFTAENRQMDFYSDFSNRDSYLYYIKFDKNINLLESIEPIEISNDQVNVIIDVKQVSKNAIKIESFFALSGKVGVDEVDIMEEVYNKLFELNNSQIRFKEDYE